MVCVRVSVAVGFPLVPVDGEVWPLSSVPGIEGIQAPNHTFPLWDLVPPFIFFWLGLCHFFLFLCGLIVFLKQPVPVLEQIA